MKSQTESVVRNTVAKMHLARSEDIESLKAEIDKLRVEISSLKQEKESTGIPPQ
jgi:polyhydroxyalkanoate synthesis regulator phasin